MNFSRFPIEFIFYFNTFYFIDMNGAEKSVRLSDFQEMFKYFTLAFAGKCLRSYMLQYFDDEPNTTQNLLFCCTGCETAKGYTFRHIPELISVLQSLAFLKNRGISKV